LDLDIKKGKEKLEDREKATETWVRADILKQTSGLMDSQAKKEAARCPYT